MGVLSKTYEAKKARAIRGAMDIGYNLRPSGYQGKNDAWLCLGCGAISKGAPALMKQHGDCCAENTRALVEAEKCL